MHQQQTALENIVGKGEIARIEQFLLFPQCFQLNQIIVYPLVCIFDIVSLFAAELEEPKAGISGKALTPFFRRANQLFQDYHFISLSFFHGLTKFITKEKHWNISQCSVQHIFPSLTLVLETDNESALEIYYSKFAKDHFFVQ